MNQHTTKTRVAVTGPGKRGLLHASLINALPDNQLVALNESKGIVRSFARKMSGNINTLGNTGEPVNYSPDAGYVTTPPSSHLPIIRQIFSDKIARNIFVEKPLADNQQQAEEIFKLIPYNCGFNMAGYQKRFAIIYRKANELLGQWRNRGISLL